ncbi:MAG: ABC transporter substrate-binding protein [Dehalococcoidia bacterium]
MAKTAETLAAEVWSQAYPEIARYHWSKLTISKNQPKRGGRMKMGTVLRHADLGSVRSVGDAAQRADDILLQPVAQPDLTLESALAGQNNMFDLVLNGDLSKSWEQPDKTTYTFKLREHQFHDIAPVNGRQLTAEDFVYSYRQYLETKAVGQAAIFRDVDKFEAVDKGTTSRSTKKPVAYLLNSLSAPLVFVIAKEARERADGLKPDPPIGTGPFIMKEHKFRNTLKMDRNPAYFREGRPCLDGIDATWLGDAATAAAAYRTGQVDTINYVRAGEWTALQDLLKTEGWTREGGKSDVHVNQMNSGGNTQFAWRVNQPAVQRRAGAPRPVDGNRPRQADRGRVHQGTVRARFPDRLGAPGGRPWPHEKRTFQVVPV